MVRLRTPEWRIAAVRLGHPGVHQAANAALAVAALSLGAQRQRFPGLDTRAIARGLHNVVRNTGLGGRMQRLRCGGIPVLVDVAHNPDGMRVLADTLSAAGVVYPIAVFGILRDKDAGAVLDELRRVAKEIVAVKPDTERARDGRETARLATERGILAVDGGNVRQGIALAIRRLRAGYPPSRRKLLVVGSHYLAGEALEFLGKPGNQKLLDIVA